MSSQQKREPWRNTERHYCAICNAWMGSDRQSIMIHENGKKHQEKLKENLKQRQQDKIKQERQKTELEKSLLKMERIANMKSVEDSKFFGGVCYSAGNSSVPAPVAPPPGLNACPINALLKGASTELNSVKSNTPHKSSTKDKVLSKKEIDSWNERKKRRIRDKFGTDEDDNEVDENETKKKKTNRTLGQNDGHYIIDDKIYLEGQIYAPLFVKDMPIQIWTGLSKANNIDLKKYENQNYWKTGLICKIYKKKRDAENKESADLYSQFDFTCDIAYLRNPSDADETFEQMVQSNLLRILVGSGNDPEDGIPASLEEARLELLGGEEHIVVKENDSINMVGVTEEKAVDENTGFTSWNTVAIRKVTVNKELKEERARIKAKRQFESELKEKNEKDIEERKMEEARYANADDSALGAYDVWNVTAKAKGGTGYKGVDINSENKVDHVAEAASELSKGKSAVTFKKKKLGGFKNAKNKKKKFRRVTSADD